MRDLFIHQGGTRRRFSLPEGWRLLTFAARTDAPALTDIRAAVRRSLDRPFGGPRLAERVSPSDRVAILVEDLTRTSPKRILLETVLADLVGAGLTPERISVIIALGTHRPLSGAELEAAFGPQTVRAYRFVNHDCQSPDLVAIGRLPWGTPVRIHPEAAGADITIGIGSIFPHPMNGFGGGAKILFPGVADLASILDHHFRLTFHPGTALGAIAGNPFNETVCDVARQAGLRFIVNSVMNPEDRACGVVAGDPVAAHLAGIEICRAAISHRFCGPADVTLISSFPYSEGPQIVKPLIPASAVTRKGGVILWAADSSTGLPEAFLDAFARFHREHAGDLRAAAHRYFAEGRVILPGGAIDFNMALGLTLAIQQDWRILMISRDLTRDQAARMGMDHAGSLEEAFARVERIIPQPAMHVVPAGGTLLPAMDP